MKRAVQYLRMSTDHQRYSLKNQAAHLSRYAEQNGFEILRSYEDAGKSGLTIRGREGLKTLLSDVLGESRDFDSILVLDVSRWGRFQNPDQAAHYEFLCFEAGVSVIYCAEPFGDENTPVTSLLKAMKRVMAGEYSRELSAKIAFAQRQAAGFGFKQGGPAGYGFRRVLIGPDGEQLGTMHAGQWNMYRGHRVRYVQGPPEETKVIRQIFRWRVRDGLAVKEIKRRLIRQEVPPPEGRSTWTDWLVRGVLQNELVLGNYVYGRSKKSLGQAQRTFGHVPIRVKVVRPIISKALFEAAAKLKRGSHMTDEDVLRALKQHISEVGGRVSQISVNACPYLPSSSNVVARFGSLTAAYGLVGHTQNWRSLPNKSPAKAHSKKDIIKGLKRLTREEGYACASKIAKCDYLPSVTYIYRVFTSLREAYAEAGLPSDKSDIQLAGARRSAARRALTI